MVVAAELSGTKKHYTNHSICKTTVKKLEKVGINLSKIIVITGHKNQQGLADYGELDIDFHVWIEKVLSYDRNSLLLVASNCMLDCSRHDPTPAFNNNTAKLL